MRKLLDPEKSFAILKRYSIPYSECKISKNAKQAAAAAKKMGFPVALKVVSKEIVHKSDIGGVKIGLADEQEVIKAFDEIIQTTKKKLKKRPKGVLVQKMESGIEVIIGLKRDAQFGPVVLFGLGGIFVEILKDVSLRIAPLTKEDCLDMIEELKGCAILKGARGQKAVNINELVGILMSVSRAGIKNKNITEMDLNPVIVNEKSAKVVDIRIITEK